MIRLKIKSPAGGSDCGEGTGGGGSPSSAVSGEGKRHCCAAQTLQETEALLDNFMYLWKEAEGKGEEKWRD